MASHGSSDANNKYYSKAKKNTPACVLKTKPVRYLLTILANC